MNTAIVAGWFGELRRRIRKWIDPHEWMQYC